MSQENHSSTDEEPKEYPDSDDEEWNKEYQYGTGGDGYMWDKDETPDKFWISLEQRMLWRWRHRDPKAKAQPNNFNCKCDFCFIDYDEEKDEEEWNKRSKEKKQKKSQIGYDKHKDPEYKTNKLLLQDYCLNKLEWFIIL
jgi:hypothetical protein